VTVKYNNLIDPLFDFQVWLAKTTKDDCFLPSRNSHLWNTYVIVFEALAAFLWY